MARPPSAESILRNEKKQKQKFEPKTPIATDMFLPNQSGDHSAGHTGTPVNDMDIANKKYVDAYNTIFSAGSIIFSNGTNFAQDNSNLFWNDVNKKLGIGTASPVGQMELKTPGTMRFRNAVSSGFDIGLWAGAASSDGYIFNRDTGGKLVFGTNNIERMRIQDDGKVGIGTATPGSKLEVNGAISSATANFSAVGPTDNVAVAGVNTLFVNTASNNVTIGGFANGVAGQTLHVIKTSSANILTLEQAEGGGSQDIYLHDGADENIGITKWGGFHLVCDGTDWWDVAHK